MKAYYQFCTLLLVVLSPLLYAQEKLPEMNSVFLQDVKTHINLPEGVNKNVIHLFQDDDEIIAVTPSEVCRYFGKEWKVIMVKSGIVEAALDDKGELWLSTTSGIQKEEGEPVIALPVGVPAGSVLCMLWEGSTLHLGTKSGLFSWSGSWKRVKALAGEKVNDLAKDQNGILWAATENGLFKRTPKEWQNLDNFLMANGTLGKYYSLHVPETSGDLVFGSPFSVGCISQKGEHWMVSGTEGLPYGPVTAIRSLGETFWFATDKGAIKKDDSWHYYHGKRWLPGNKVNDVLPVDEYTTWIATVEGISQIRQVGMTFEEKAAHYEKVIEARHNRRGIINFSHLDVPGDLSSSRMENQDNDGLWTSVYLAAECFRYAVTKTPDALEKAVRTFEALEWLELVTGIPGLPARSYAMITDSVQQSRSPHPKRWRPSPDKNWQWLDDTSSDEMVGHFFAIALFYDLVADSKMKQRVKELVQRSMDHIIENDFHLIDYDGKPTRWGVWHPDSLNHSMNWAYEKGLYSLELLSFLKIAVHITGDQKYEKVYRQLIEEHDYAENTRYAKIHGPFENSHSDDILTYFPYYCMSRYAQDDEFWPIYKASIERTWAVSRSDRMPVWNIIASVVLEKDCDLEIAKEELQEYPLDLIDWNMINSHRWDLTHDPLVDRGKNKQATVPIPAPESRIYRWNTNPRILDTGVGGKREDTGTYFLLPYWMARYHQLYE